MLSENYNTFITALFNECIRKEHKAVRIYNSSRYELISVSEYENVEIHQDNVTSLLLVKTGRL